MVGKSKVEGATNHMAAQPSVYINDMHAYPTYENNSNKTKP